MILPTGYCLLDRRRSNNEFTNIMVRNFKLNNRLFDFLFSMMVDNVHGNVLRLALPTSKHRCTNV